MIAIVEDEDTIREAVSFALRQQGHHVQGFSDGLDAWTAFDAALPDLVILDIGVPRLDGLELCRRLRGRSEALPIIFVTSREDEFDRVLGLEIGADDYLCKPFSMRELLARIKVLLRRASLAAGAAGAAGASGTGANAREDRDDRDRHRAQNGADDDEERLLDAGSLRLDLQRYTATWKGRALALTVTEFLLLQALARHPGHVKTRDQLMQHAYPDNTFVSDRTIDSHVKRVRRKLEEIDPAFDAIETVYGLGYRFTPDTVDEHTS
jgi:two-component system, OmpR family, response regulator ChvI